MSRFQISTTRYSACAPDPGDTRLFDTDLAEAEERHMVYTVEETIRHGEMFRHEYDYGDTTHLEVWPESHWPGFALCQADVLQSYTA